MSILGILGSLFARSGGKPGSTVSLVMTPGYNSNMPIQRDKDRMLTEKTSLFQLTLTSNAALQQQNRILSDFQVQALTRLARFRDSIEEICLAPVVVHSGYRSPDLNGATVGSSSTSQHPRCEAIDFHVEGQDLEETFIKLRGAAAGGSFRFGQLIIEEAKRDYAVVRWLHCSLIGTLSPEKVGQVLRMKDGKYEFVERAIFQS